VIPSPLTLALPDLEATVRLGRLLGELLQPGDVILLTGPLGAGKTTLTQALGQGIGVAADCYITSPSFSLAHEYQGRLPLYHLDLYRLDSEEEIEELGFLDFIYGRGATVIEWPERLGRLKPSAALELNLSFAGESSRAAILTPVGEQWRARLIELEQRLG
jgi:tRNA threonylcarbamoyladenosine biosynthesis protein TsaE